MVVVGIHTIHGSCWEPFFHIFVVVGSGEPQMTVELWSCAMSGVVLRGNIFYLFAYGGLVVQV